MIYALLVGINTYKSPKIGSLDACLVDVAHMKSVLEQKFPEQERHIITLTNKQATRKAIIDHLQGGLFNVPSSKSATEGKVWPTTQDIVLIHFSGHGSRELAADEFGPLSPEGKNETLICWDSRTDDIPDLADKELAVLLADIAKENPQLVLIIDACHSGSITRSADNMQLGKSRFTEASGKKRKLSTYLNGHYQKMLDRNAFITIPTSPHILLAGCSKHEEAHELGLNQGGVFTTTLFELLEKDKQGELTYADLFVNARATIRRWAGAQTPQFEAYNGFNTYNRFLGHETGKRLHTYPVVFKEDEGGGDSYWELGYGAIQGLPTESATPVLLNIFKGRNTTPVAAAKVVQIKPKTSKLEIVKGSLDQREGPYQAAITNLPIDPMILAFQGERRKLRSLKARLKGVFPVKIVDPPVKTDYGIEATGTVIKILHIPSQTILGGVDIRDKSLMDQAYGYLYNKVLQSISRWENVLGLQNHQPKLDPSNVSFELIEYQGDREISLGADVTLDCSAYGKWNDGSDKWKSGEHSLRLTNNTDQPLFAACYWLSSAFGIEKINQIEVDANSNQLLEFVSTKTGKVRTKVYGVFAKRETGNETEDIFKLVIGTERIDDFLFKQDHLPIGEASIKVFDKVRKEMRGKAKGLDDEEDEEIERITDDWFTKVIRRKLVKQLATVSAKKESEMAGGKLKVEKHNAIEASLALQSAQTSTRKDPIAVIPDILARSGIRLVNFSGTRGAGENVVEMSDISHAEGVNEANPLTFNISTSLEEDEVIIPLTFDGKDIIPIGDTVGVTREGPRTIAKVQITQVPEEQVKSRSLGRSLKMVFAKIVRRKPAEALYLLRKVNYRWDMEDKRFRSKITGKLTSSKILICMHGIIGDTKEMADAVRFALKSDKNPHGYDQVLTFDYENLNTPIEAIAGHFKTQLKRVGLDETTKTGDNPRTVDILAHSMGGLVSRWFIEQEDGNLVINRLIMAGTPNNGSPFGLIADYRNMALNALLFGLNIPFLQGLLPWAAGLISVLQGSKALTKTLAQMHVKADPSEPPFLTRLNNSADPGIQYYVLVGNTEKYQEVKGEDASRFIDKVLLRVGDLFNEEGQHDIAVSANSIRGLPENRKVIEPVLSNGDYAAAKAGESPGLACHHLNYFEENSEGLRVLEKVLLG